MAKKKQRENAPADIAKCAQGAACKPARRKAVSGDLKALARCLLNGGARSTPASVVAVKPPASRPPDGGGDAVRSQQPTAKSARVYVDGSEPVHVGPRRAEPDSWQHAEADSGVAAAAAASRAALARVVVTAAATTREKKKKKRAKKKLRSMKVEGEKRAVRGEQSEAWRSGSDDGAAAAAAAAAAGSSRTPLERPDADAAAADAAVDSSEHGDVDDYVDDGNDDSGGESAAPDTTLTSSLDVSQADVRSGFWVRDSDMARIESVADGGSQSHGEALVSICETAFPLALQGACQLRHVSGRALRMHGFNLRPGDAFWDVHSPNLYPHLVLSIDDSLDDCLLAASTAADDSCVGSSAAARSDPVPGVQSPPEAVGAQPRWVTLALRPLLTAEALLRGTGNSYRRLLELPALPADCPGLLACLGGARLLAAAAPESNGLLEPAVGLHESLSQLEATATLPIVLVCGGKNAGKSTLTRHIVNSLLNRYDSVFYLDVDPGQTEFTPPGCVALKKVTAPLFGPPWTHVGDVDVSVRFVGSTSPHGDPDHYVQCVHSLVEEYEMHRQRGAPLVVNTMGWVQNLGLNLLLDTLRLVKPSLVVQISSASSANKNLPPLAPGQLPCNTWNMQQQADGQADQLNFISCHLWSHCPSASTAATAADESFGKGWPLKNTGTLGAPQCRDLMTFAYFGHLWASSSWEPRASDPQSFINAAPPYAVPWGSVVVQLCAGGGASLPEHLVLGALNASVVVLASVDQPKKVLDTNSAVKMIDAGVPTSYVGFGLVRAIDVSRRLFYITTPVSPKLLCKVNCLRKGMGIELPAAILTKQGCLAGQTLPYVDVHRQGVGTRSSQSTPRNYCAFGRNRR